MIVIQSLGNQKHYLVFYIFTDCVGFFLPTQSFVLSHIGMAMIEGKYDNDK
jgi:hypothetical protein